MVINIITNQIERAETKLLEEAVCKLGESVIIVDPQKETYRFPLTLSSSSDIYLSRIDVANNTDPEYLTAMQLLTFIEVAFPYASIVNGRTPLELCQNKLLAQAAFEASRLPTPYTIAVQTKEAAHIVVDRWEKYGNKLIPFIVFKPLYGGRGEGMYLFETEQETNDFIDRSDEPYYYFQEFLDLGGRDYRFIADQDRVLAAYVRVSDGKDWRTNISQGARREAISRVPSYLEEIACQAVRAVGGGILGVDIAISGKKPYLL
ncbi:ATP-grasp domain-containing protein [Candidatus Woesearchaeota archaeon]|nr:ATP-grasp domain-containing protein [Candidatus Woesearchaeota archaeon]